MAMLGRLKDLLENQRIPYEVLTHPEMFTAQEIAAACHIAGKEMAKVVIVKDRNRFVMAVLPASWRLDLRKLKEVLGSPD
ncbi:MAG: YbaK/EbsC family protein, partial [Nitrospirae bacterium]|nr:YbaK/EbsC family protein [Nitrospirota bacterium]